MVAYLWWGKGTKVAGGSYRVLLARAEGVYKDRRSRFISYLQPIQGEADANLALHAIRSEHHAARHVCHALIIDETEPTVWSDDGEPNGSAGRPILYALQRAELLYTLGVVVRYFGGIKLGVSGLIAAYRGAVEAALEVADIGEQVRERELSLECPYGEVNVLRRYIKETGGRIVSEHYDALQCYFGVAWEEDRVRAVEEWTESYGVSVRIEGVCEGRRVVPAPYVGDGKEK